jgi:outer membrane receptor protein involved in Fe transport
MSAVSFTALHQKPEIPMKFAMTYMVAFLIMFTSMANAQAATEREKSLEDRIQQLESQLDDANETIADLQEQLGSGSAVKAVDEAEPDRTAAADSQPYEGKASKSPAALAAVAVASERFTRQVDSETPASVTSLGHDDLLLGGVEDVSRLEFLVPGLRYGQTGHDVRLSMRGARTNSIGAETESPVAMFEDGIYMPTSTERLSPFFDVERIDVLRGPQVAAFGQRAYAGAISIVNNKPNFEGFSGWAELENGLPDKTRWRMAANMPASDTLAFRVAGISESRSGWIDNTYIESDADDMNDRKVQVIRGSILWRPSDRFNMLFWTRYHDENGTGSAPWGYQQIGAYVDGELEPGNRFVGPGASPDYGPWGVTRNFISNAAYENWVNTLELNWDTGFADLKWLSNFTSFHGRQVYDNDYTDLGEPTSTPFAGWSTDRQRTWSSELRLTSKNDGPLTWLAGLFYGNRRTEWGWVEAHRSEYTQPEWDIPGEYEVNSTAAFGQMTYAWDNGFSVTGGLRWTEDEKTTKSGVEDSWSEVLWKAALQYDLSDRTMTWFSASTGFQPGGINTAPGVQPFWDKEKLTAYELGLKTVMADGKVQLNTAAWYNDFSDVQSQAFLVMPYPGSPEATEYTGNGGSSDAKGIEAEIQWSPMPQWSIASQISYTDAKFGNFSAPNLPGLGVIPGHTDGDSLNYKGWRPALSPKWVIGLQTSYSFALGDLGTLTPYLQTTYASEYYANDINLDGVRQGSHTRTDLRLIWLSPGGSMQFQFYYLNAEDDAILNWARVYNPAVRPDITTLQANWGNPNTYGVMFDWRF